MWRHLEPNLIGTGQSGVNLGWQTLTSGNLYVRITKPGVNQQTVGSLVLFYFPYMGS